MTAVRERETSPDDTTANSARVLRERTAAVLLELEAYHGGRENLTARHVLSALGAANLMDPRPQHVTTRAELLVDVLDPVQAAAVAAHTDVALPALAEAGPGTMEQDVPPARRGAWIFAFPLTDPPARLELTPVPGGLRISGLASGYPAGEDADAFLVPLAAPHDGGCPAAVVSTGAESVRLVPSDARRPTAAWELSDVFVPHDRVVRVSDRRRAAARLWLAAYELGAARLELNRTCRLLKMRRSFGVPLSRHQAVGFRLADLAARTDGVQALVEAAAEDGITAFDPLLAVAELHASRLLWDVAAQCLHLHGAAGQVAGSATHRLLTEARSLAITRNVDQRAAEAVRAAKGWLDGHR
ncbi:acyl-CoA dehydrogenase family protein [Streptomyces sp. NPDC050528]|uniref:acyl-CoA dehydrogenase family protein n=1 Tax=unclassified Streptomyces TaxID=2593676 RepID=UPI0037A1549C